MTIVVTGIGQMIAGGLTPEDLLDGSTSSSPEVDETTTIPWIPRKNLRKMDKLSKMTTAAAAMALEDAALIDSDESNEIGLIVDTAFGSAGVVVKVLEGIFDKDPMISPLLFPNVVANASSGQVAMAYRLRGPSSTLGGIGGLLYAYDLIASGRASRLVVGGSDEITDIYDRAFTSVGISDVVPRFGEGAAFIVLESAESAERRGAPVYSELAHVSQVSDPGFRLCGARAFNGDGFEHVAADVLVDESGVDYLFGAGWPQTGLREKERWIAQQHGIPLTTWPKDATGELFACSNALSTVLASALIGRANGSESVLVSGYDCTRGQSAAALFRSYRKGGKRS